MNKLRDLIQLRALALVIASQSLEIRRHLQELLMDSTSSEQEICQEEIPEINWAAEVETETRRIKLWQESGIRIISYFEAGYPAVLKTIEDPPFLLFFRGAQISLLAEQYCLAIVGSRRADQDGLELAQNLAHELAKLGITIISGMALGIDGAAHRGALSASSVTQTVAVLGSGLNILYPPQHASLAEEIINSGGIIISQFEPDVPPYPSNFLNRNRIVSGLSKAVLVVEATLKSGSLVTARNALEQGKDVLVIPGDINNPRFEGSNKLIQQGATLVTSVQDIVEALNIKSDVKSQNISHSKNNLNLPLASKIEMQIIENLKSRKEMRVDEMIRLLGNVSFEKELLMLELQGLILRLPGNILRLKKSF